MVWFQAVVCANYMFCIYKNYISTLVPCELFVISLCKHRYVADAGVMIETWFVYTI